MKAETFLKKLQALFEKKIGQTGLLVVQEDGHKVTYYIMTPDLEVLENSPYCKLDLKRLLLDYGSIKTNMCHVYVKFSWASYSTERNLIIKDEFSGLTKDGLRKALWGLATNESDIESKFRLALSDPDDRVTRQEVLWDEKNPTELTIVFDATLKRKHESIPFSMKCFVSLVKQLPITFSAFRSYGDAAETIDDLQKKALKSKNYIEI